MQLSTFQDFVAAFNSDEIDYYDRTYKYGGDSPNHREAFFTVFKNNFKGIYSDLWKSIKTINQIQFKYGRMANAEFTEEALQMSILYFLEKYVNGVNTAIQGGQFDPTSMSLEGILRFFSTNRAKEANDLDKKDDLLEEITSLMDFTAYHPMTTDGLIRSVAQREMSSLLGKSEEDLKAIKEALEDAPQTGASHTNRIQREIFMGKYHDICTAIVKSIRTENSGSKVKYYYESAKILVNSLAKYQKGDDIRIHLGEAFNYVVEEYKRRSLNTLSENALQNPLNECGVAVVNKFGSQVKEA